MTHYAKSHPSYKKSRPYYKNNILIIKNRILLVNIRILLIKRVIIKKHIFFKSPLLNVIINNRIIKYNHLISILFFFGGGLSGVVFMHLENYKSNVQEIEDLWFKDLRLQATQKNETIIINILLFKHVHNDNFHFSLDIIKT